MRLYGIELRREAAEARTLREYYCMDEWVSLSELRRAPRVEGSIKIGKDSYYKK